MLRWMTMLMGPVFAKEMVEMARRKRYYFNRVLYGGILLFVLFSVWENYQWRLRLPNAPAQRVMADMAQTLFQAVSWVQFGAIFLFVPIFLCGTIAAEREERTLELLFTTQMADRQIVVGKLASRAVALILLTLCGLPVLSLIMLFGGIDPAALWRALGTMFVAILFVGSFAIYFSAITKSAMGALVRTYWYLGLWMLALPALMGIIIDIVYRTRMPPLYAMYCMGSLVFVNPAGAFMVGLNGFFYNAFAANTPLLGPWFYPFTLILPAAWSIFLIRRAVLKLRLTPTAMPPWLLRFLRRFRNPEIAINAKWRQARRRERAGRTWYTMPVRNPFWLRARLTPVYDREGHIRRIEWAAYYVALFFIVILSLFADHRAMVHHSTAMTFIIIAWIVGGALLTIIAGSSLVGDLRRGFLELVIITPLSARQIVHGTALAVWHHVHPLAGLIGILSILFCLTGALEPGWMLLSLIPGTLFCALILFHGLACSLAARSMAPALVGTFALPLMTLIGELAAFAIFRENIKVGIFISAAAVLVGSLFWLRRRFSLAATTCHLLAVYFVFVSAALIWMPNTERGDGFMAAMHPGYWLSMLMRGRPEDAFHDYSRWRGSGIPPATVAWEHVFICYIGALLACLAYLNWWTVHFFDRLVDRVRNQAVPRPRKPKVVARDAIEVPSSSRA